MAAERVSEPLITRVGGRTVGINLYVRTMISDSLTFSLVKVHK